MTIDEKQRIISISRSQVLLFLIARMHIMKIDRLGPRGGTYHERKRTYTRISKTRDYIN